jgi:DNA-directed RNA polymerase III subunit RPC3
MLQLIVDSIFQHVASVLLNRGRLNLTELCHYAKLRPRSAQAVIIILIQHNLAWHCEAPAGDHLIEYFEMNQKECLMRLRWGRILAMTEDEFGEDVGESFGAESPYLLTTVTPLQGRMILELLLTRGKLRLPEILDAMNVHDETREYSDDLAALQAMLMHSYDLQASKSLASSYSS